jgi:hypothetical protein
MRIPIALILVLCCLSHNDNIYNEKIEYLKTLDMIRLKEIADQIAKTLSQKKLDTEFHHEFPTPQVMEKDEIIKFIIKGLQLLNSSTIPATNNKIFLAETIPIGGGIHDHLHAYDRDKLIAVTLALEKYHKQVVHEEKILGGMHDYVWRIPDDELRSYIIREVNEHPEIADFDTIEEMAKEFERKKEDEFTLDQEVRDYLPTLERNMLEKLATKLEKYHRKQSGTEKFIGGLHDYITYLPNDEIHNYIVREIKCHAELNKVEELKKILEANQGSKLLFLDYSEKKVDSLPKAIEGATRERLELALHKLNEKLGNKYKFLLNSLHPFSNEDLRSFIKKIVNDNMISNVDDI